MAKNNAKMMILQNAAEQQIQNKLINTTGQYPNSKNSRVLVDQQHIKIKSMSKQMAATNNPQMPKHATNPFNPVSSGVQDLSPSQDISKKAGSKVIIGGQQSQAVQSKDHQQALISHKKSNSLMTQKMMQLLLENNQDQQQISQGNSALNEPVYNQIVQNDKSFHGKPVIGSPEIDQFTIDGPASKTAHGHQNVGHIKSKSFMHNDEFVSASADNSHLNNQQYNNKNIIMAKQQQMHIPTTQNNTFKQQHKKIVQGINYEASGEGQQVNKLPKNLSQKHNQKRSSDKPKKSANVPQTAPLGIKNKLISNSFDKTAGGGGKNIMNNNMQVMIGSTVVSGGPSKLQQQINEQNLKSNKLGQKQSSFIYNQNKPSKIQETNASSQANPSLFTIAGGKKGKVVVGHGPGGNIHTAGMPSSFQSAAATQAQVSGQQSIMTSSTQNLNQVQKRKQIQKPQIANQSQAQGHIIVQPSHHRTKSDAHQVQSLNFQMLQNASNEDGQGPQNLFNPQKSGGTKSNYIISSSNHVYPPQQAAKIQNKKAANLKSMSSNNQISQVSSQGATKGLLKVGQQQSSTQSKGPQKNQNPIKSKGGPIMQIKGNQPHHKKNQISTQVRSNYKKLINDQNSAQEMNPEKISSNSNNPSHSRDARSGKATNNPMIDIDVFSSSQNKTTEQKYAELKMKYNDLLSKHFALAAQKTEDNRHTKGHAGSHYGGPGASNINSKGALIKKSIGSNQQLISSFQIQPSHPQSQQQTLEPPQIIMMNNAASSRALDNPSTQFASRMDDDASAGVNSRKNYNPAQSKNGEYSKKGQRMGSMVSRGSGGTEGHKSSKRHQIDSNEAQGNIRYSQELYSDNIIVQHFDDQQEIQASEMINYEDNGSEGMDGIATMNANSDAEAELNLIIGSQSVSQNQTPRDLMKTAAEASQQPPGLMRHLKSNTEGPAQKVPNTNITQNNGILINSNIYHINLNQGSSSIGNTIISRIEGQGSFVNGQAQSDEQSRRINSSQQNKLELNKKALGHGISGSFSHNPAGNRVGGSQSPHQKPRSEANSNTLQDDTEDIQPNAEAPTRAQKGLPITHHKRSVSDGGIFNNMGLKAKAKQVQSQNSGTYVITDSKVNPLLAQQQQIPLKQGSQKGQQASFEQKIDQMRQANGLNKPNQRYQQQKANQMLILEECEDENQERTVTHNTHNSADSNINDENVHTELGQEYDPSLKKNNMIASTHRIVNQMNDERKIQQYTGKQAQPYTKTNLANFNHKNPNDPQKQGQKKNNYQSRSFPRKKDKQTIESPNFADQSENSSLINAYNDPKLTKVAKKLDAQRSGNVAKSPNNKLNSNTHVDQVRYDNNHRKEQRFQHLPLPSQASQEQLRPAILNQENVMLEHEQSINDNGMYAMQDGGTASDGMHNAFGQYPHGPNNKVINVSFNDFNQSISNDYDDNRTINIQEEQNIANKPKISRGSSLENQDNQLLGKFGQKLSSNKNLNNFLEALQKIKPQNPINNNAAKESTSKKPQEQSKGSTQQVIPNSLKSHKIIDKGQIKKHKKNKSEIPPAQNQGHYFQGLQYQPQSNIDNHSGIAKDIRLEKYHKMKQKVKQNDNHYNQSIQETNASFKLQSNADAPGQNSKPSMEYQQSKQFTEETKNDERQIKRQYGKHQRIKSTNEGLQSASGDQLILSQQYKKSNPRLMAKANQSRWAVPGGHHPMRYGNNSQDMDKMNPIGASSPITQKQSARESINGQDEEGHFIASPKGTEIAGHTRYQNVSHGIPVSGTTTDQNSHKDLKITFVGDQSLLLQHQSKMKAKSQKKTGTCSNGAQNQADGNIHYVALANNQNFKQDGHLPSMQNKVGGQNPFLQLNSASCSNTGGQPSPIISTKRVPQKVLAQNGDSSLPTSQPSSSCGNPSKYKGKMITTQLKKKQQVQQNNYIDGQREQYEADQGQIVPNRAERKTAMVNQGKNYHKVKNPSLGNNLRIQNDIEFNVPQPISATPQIQIQEQAIEEGAIADGVREALQKRRQSRKQSQQQNQVFIIDNPHHDFFNNQDGEEVQVISDLDDTPNNMSPLTQSQQQLINQEQLQDQNRLNLIQNLNKNNFFSIDEQSDQVEEDLSLDAGNQQQHIHIIQHPMPSMKGSKKKNQNFPQADLAGMLNLPQAPQVSERLVTEDSNNGPGGNGGELTPRSKKIRKLIKLIKLSFRQTQSAPDTTIDFYRIGKILGKGAFGKVNLAVHILTQQLCAVKSINKKCFSDQDDESESQMKKVMQEVVMLKKTRHQNIVRLYEYFETDKHILFVIELCAGGDLLNYVRRRRRLKEDVAKCLFKQIVESLAYCHSKNIVHRDIKLDNILLDAFGRVKICDFGVGKIVKKGEKMTEQCGTPAYIAPEILRDKGYYGFAVDIWSAGVALYAMLYGTVPFKANNMNELQKIIMKAKYTLKDDISAESRDLLKCLLDKDPEKRITIGGILNHAWLQDAPQTEDIDLFTEQEMQYIKSEFCYHKSTRYARNQELAKLGFNLGGEANQISPFPLQEFESSPSELDKDMFTEHMLDSTQNSILKNAQTKSVILAPFNSTKSNLDEENDADAVYEFSDSVKELIVDKKIIKFGPRVRDIDKQYEINNNADLDNGVYHKFDEDEEENQNQEEVKGDTEEQSDEQDEPLGDLEPEDQEILQELKKQAKKKKEQKGKNTKKQSELQRLENMIQDQEQKEMLNQLDANPMGGNAVTENSENDNEEIASPHQEQPQDQFIVIDEQVRPAKNQQNDNIKIVECTDESSDSPRKSDKIQQQNDQKLAQLLQQQLIKENIEIHETTVQQVEEFGYPRDYILKCLNNRELNYATTSYQLLHFSKKK